MPYLISVTRKGQMTLPKDIRKFFGIIPPARVLVDFDKRKKTIKIEKLDDIMKLAARFRVPRGKSAIKARQYLEKNYLR